MEQHPNLRLLMRSTLDVFRTEVSNVDDKDLIALGKMIDTSLAIERMRIDAINDRLKTLVDANEAELQRSQLHRELTSEKSRLEQLLAKQVHIEFEVEQRRLSPPSYQVPVARVLHSPGGINSNAEPTPLSSDDRWLSASALQTHQFIKQAGKSQSSDSLSAHQRVVYQARGTHDPTARRQSQSKAKPDRASLLASQERIIDTIRRRRDSNPHDFVPPPRYSRPPLREFVFNAETAPDYNRTLVLEVRTDPEHMETQTTVTRTSTTQYVTRSWRDEGDEYHEPRSNAEPSYHSTTATTTYVKSAPSLQEPLYHAKQPPHHKKDRSPTSMNGLPEISTPVIPLGDRPKVDVGVANLGEHAVAGDSTNASEWDPTPMIEAMYKIDYTPRLERKNHRFVNMEGHLGHLPLGTKNAVTEEQWKDHYFKTKEGRLVWYGTSYADDKHSIGDILLSGSTVVCNREELTFTVQKGRDHAFLIVKSPLQLYDKWRKALESHAAATLNDTFCTPLYPPMPHYTQKIAIIEVGSASVRAGVLTNEYSLPQTFFPNMATVLETGDVIVGKECLKPAYRRGGTVVRPLLPITPGAERYTMHNDIMRCVLHKVFEDLNITPGNYHIMLTVPQNAPISIISEMMHILLDDFRCASVAVSRQPVLVLYAYDVTTGIVVDIGERCNIVPIVDGYVVENAIVSLPYAGQQLCDALRANLNEQHSAMYAFQSPVDRMILRYITENAAYLAVDYDQEVQNAKSNSKGVETTVSLKPFEPTSNMMSDYTLGSARFTSAEGLYNPKRWSLDIQGLQKLIYGAVQTAPMDSRKPLYKNIYVAGGLSLLPNFVERLEVELEKLVSSNIQVNVSMSPWRYHAAYLGAQVVAQSPQFAQTAVIRSQLEQYINNLKSANF